MAPSAAAESAPASESVTFRGGASGHSAPPDVRILHYNDVYHLDPSSAEPVGGVSRFVTVVDEYRSGERFSGQPDLLTLFSGDAFNPSLESSVTKGSHMVPMLNRIGTDVATVGNHDLDFGVRQFRSLTGKCGFPWLLANMLDPALGDGVPLGNAKRTHMLTSSNGLKIGVIGLGEREWLETVNALPPNIVYRSATQTARELVPQLRRDGADMIVALTHMREPNDNTLADNLGGDMIDLILGGHDHFYSHSFINGTHVLRSGSDFKQLSYIEARRRPGSPTKWDFDIWRRDIVSSVPQDEETVALADSLTARLKESLDRPVGWTAAPLDARFTTVRTRESNLGNFICDIMRHHYQSDCSIMASGTIRGDQIYSPGPVRVKDITDCFPFEDPVVVIKVNGQALWDALENGVSSYPALEGRFPQVSNIFFEFDPSRPSGARVLSAQVGQEALQREKEYKVTTRGYMARGKDGYTSLLIKPEGGTAEEIVSEENGILISMMLRQYFMYLKVLDRWTHWGPSMDRHWGRVGSDVHKCHPVMSPGLAGVERECSTPIAQCDLSSGWADWTPTKMRQRRASLSPLDEHHLDDDNGGYTPPEDGRQREQASWQSTNQEMDSQLRVMRRVFGKWCRIAGVHGNVCDTLHAEELTCDWTKAIAPRVEGRIIMRGDMRAL